MERPSPSTASNVSGGVGSSSAYLGGSERKRYFENGFLYAVSSYVSNLSGLSPKSNLNRIPYATKKSIFDSGVLKS